jgi:hypothetical protein
MNGISNTRRRLRIIQRALVHFHIIAGIFLLPTTELCADTNATQEIAEQAKERAAEKATEKSATETAKKTVEIMVEKTAREAEEKQKLTATRPDELRGPTKVHFVVFVLDVDAIDDANQNFMTNVFVRLKWKDKRLANPQGATRRIQLEEAWNPQIILANRQGVVSRSLPDVLQVSPDGTVTYRQRYSGLVSQPLQLEGFPMDKHSFTIHFTSAAYSTEELEFVAGTLRSDPPLIGGDIATVLSLPDWKVLSYQALALPYQPVEEIRYAGFAFQFEAERYVPYYLWQVLLPLSVVVMMSWTSFWIQRSQPGVRIAVATSSILTLIAQRFVLASLLPRLPYMTRMDYFTVGSTLLVFLALVGVVTASYLTANHRDRMAKRVDLLARGVFPAAFLLLLGWFLVGGFK